MNQPPHPTGPPPTTNDDLLARAPHDPLASSELIERFRRLVWWQVGRFRLDHASAEDVYQTVWLRLWEHRERIRNPDHLASWLATTARREANRVRASLVRQPAVEWLGDVTDDGTDPEEWIVNDEERHQTRQALARLDSATRTFLLALSSDAATDYRTLARLLDRPIGSLGPTRRRCLDKLERQLAAG